MSNIRQDIAIINERLKKIYILYRKLSDSQGSGGGIENVNVNGSELPIVDNGVNITIPTKTSELTNDSGFLKENKIETISSNGINMSIVGKNVDIKIPTKTSEITNDSGFITSNKIEVVKVDGVTQPIVNKEVNITLPKDIIVESEGGLRFKITASEEGELIATLL